MQLISRPVKAAVAALLLVTPSMATASPVDLAYLDPITHMQWGQLTDFPNTDLPTLLSVCTPVCTGTLNGHELSGWMLASNAQVETVIRDILSTNGLTDPGPGVVRPSPDWFNAVSNAFVPNYGFGTTTVQIRGWLGYTLDGAGGLAITVQIGGAGTEQYMTVARGSEISVCGSPTNCSAWLVEISSCAVNTVASYSNQQPALNGPAAAPGALSDPAAGEPKSAGTRLTPAAFRRLRDQVLMSSPAGRRFAALYATHSPEIVRLVLTNSALRSAILNGLLQWQANAVAIADGRGAAIRVTADQARAVDEIANQLARTGSPALRKAIEEERRRQRPGFTLAQTVLREISVASGAPDPTRR